MSGKSHAKKLVKQLRRLLDRAELLLPRPPAPPRWSDYQAFRWAPSEGLIGVRRPDPVKLDDLLCIDRQKQEVIRNTAHFVSGRAANNVLLWGARGSGKSSLVKAVFNAYAGQGLRLIEVEREHLLQLRNLVQLLETRPERFLLYCDDLSFEADDASYKALKAALEGTITAPPDNLLLYATSNRRHLLPERQDDNRSVSADNGELHPGEAIEEKISLSDRFGICLSFYPLTQEQYLEIVDHWLRRLGPATPTEDIDSCHAEALRWATQRGSRSGRIARQFAIQWLNRADPAPPDSRGLPPLTSMREHEGASRRDAG